MTYFTYFMHEKFLKEKKWKNWDYKWQNGKQCKRKTNTVQSALARRMRQGCTGPPPPVSLHSYIGWLIDELCDSVIGTNRPSAGSQYSEYTYVGRRMCVL